MQKIILASGSPRRSQILQLANIPFEVFSVETDESYPASLPPAQVAIHIAANKAKAARHKLAAKRGGLPEQNLTILAADTIVVLGTNIIGKPADRNAAIETLQKLSGKKHDVITGVVILHNDAEAAFAELTEVVFNELTTHQIEYYVDAHKPFDKAGAYAIQEWIGAVGVKSINGDFYNIMGLPVSRVVIELLALQKPTK